MPYDDRTEQERCADNEWEEYLEDEKERAREWAEEKQ